jgi:hypothetical protein
VAAGRQAGGSVTESEHAARVDAWLDRSPREPAEACLRALARVFGVLQARAELTLGEVTLRSISDRVLHEAGEQFAELASLPVARAGVLAPAHLARAPTLDPGRVREATRVVLVRFLAVIGKLTAEILTPALHAALAGDAGEDQPVPLEASAAPAGRAEGEDEDPDEEEELP